MLIPLALSSEVPIYQQIRDRVVEGIASGALPAGSSLPSTRALAADCGVNFHTVNKAYDQLRREGLLQLTRKHGAVVSRDHNTGPPPPGFTDDWRSRAHTLLAEARAQGLTTEEINALCTGLLEDFAADAAGEPGRPGTGERQGTA
ncbi:GntR family transcriptional regulator [Streptomyces sp. ET3-23]|uniref:GntR family transcriptional regulator n=1 Tax=Streptomyces sp. ET3-23 TaxID=2885643 RepID=UPI001D0FCAA7|nr:GntR family transcriptional regulator [Streptomyces sp. ET3-23]MCC2279303.1 GntR family transcriptional regulator [Streptomyces sp. ET3-23]